MALKQSVHPLCLDDISRCDEYAQPATYNGKERSAAKGSYLQSQKLKAGCLGVQEFLARSLLPHLYPLYTAQRPSLKAQRVCPRRLCASSLQKASAASPSSAVTQAQTVG